MKRDIYILSIFLLLLTTACTGESVSMGSEETERTLRVNISNLQEPGYTTTTRVAYSGAKGEHTEFETGDFFGLFVLDGQGSVKATNVKVYCSGLDNQGETVWSIYKEGESTGSSSNSPLSEILGQGSTYFAYYPYSETLHSASDAEALKNYVTTFMNALTTDQSLSFTDHDLLVASNIPGCAYGQVSV